MAPNGPYVATPLSVSVDDFSYSGLSAEGNTTNIIKAAVTPAFAPQFPGINGLGISIARLDLAVSGVIPLHTHSEASELLLVVHRKLRVGLISNANQAYYKTVKKGEIFVFSQGLLHFQINAGSKPAVAFAAFGSPLPGLQITSIALFGNSLPSQIVEGVTFLSDVEVKRLKGVVGGPD